MVTCAKAAVDVSTEKSTAVRSVANNERRIVKFLWGELVRNFRKVVCIAETDSSLGELKGILPKEIVLAVGRYFLSSMTTGQ
jgi:hypothetical protein